MMIEAFQETFKPSQQTIAYTLILAFTNRNYIRAQLLKPSCIGLSICARIGNRLMLKVKESNRTLSSI